MKNIFKNLKSEMSELPTSKTQLRSFGYIVGGILVFFYILLSASGSDSHVKETLGLVGILLGVLGALLPKILLAPYLAWMLFGILMGMIVRPVVFALIYYVLFSPIAVLQRIVKGNSMKRSDTSKQSYWIVREEKWKTEDADKLY